MRQAASVALCMALAGAAACTPKVAARPTTPGQPAPEGVAAWAAAVAHCHNVDSDAPVMELASGRIGGRRVSGVSILPALTVRNEVRLSASYHGRTLFTLSGANSVMSRSPAQSSRCLIRSQLRPSWPPLAYPRVRTSTQEPLSL